MLHLIHQPYKQGAATISSALDQQQQQQKGYEYLYYVSSAMQIRRCFVEIQIFFVCPVFRFHAIKKPFVLFVQGFSKQLNDVNRESFRGNAELAVKQSC